MRQWIVVIAGLSALVGGYAIWRSLQAPAPLPEWRRTLAEYPTPPFEGHVPYSNYELRRHLWTDVLMREAWDAKTGAELANIVQALPDDFILRDDAPLDLIRAQRSARECVDVIVARLRSNAPVEDECRKIAVDTLIAYSRKADVWSRLHATQVLVYSGLADDKRVRRRLEEMAEDPHPDVAGNARRQVRAHQERRTARGG